MIIPKIKFRPITYEEQVINMTNLGMQKEPPRKS